VNGEENENEISMTTNTFESNNRDRYTKQKLTFDKNEWHKWSAAHAIKWIKALFNGNVGLNSNNSHSHSHINNNTNNNNDNNTNNNNINDDINNNDNNNIRANQCAIATTDEPWGRKAAYRAVAVRFSHKRRQWQTRHHRVVRRMRRSC
jgi:hypothetical protein